MKNFFLTLMFLTISVSGFAQFGTISRGPITGGCRNQPQLGIDITNNVLYSCGSAGVWAQGGGGSGNIASINGDTTAAQLIVGTGGINVVTSSGTTSIDGSGISGVGNVTNSGGGLVAMTCLIGNGGNDITNDPSCTLDGSGNIIVTTLETPLNNLSNGIIEFAGNTLGTIDANSFAWGGPATATFTQYGYYASPFTPNLHDCLSVIAVSAPWYEIGGASCNGAFSSITSGINTTAVMQVGTGSSLTPTGTGTITATGLTVQAANTVFGNFTGSTAAPTANAMTPCGDATHALNWTAGAGFGCQTLSGGGGGGGGFNAITSGTNTTAAMLVGTGASLATTGAGSITATAMAAGGLTSGTLVSGITHNELFSVQLFGEAAQGSAGASIGCSFPTANAPTGVVVAGSSTVPQFAAALFPSASLGTQYMECRYLLPSDFKANTVASITASMYVDTDTTNTHIIEPDVKLGCDGADGSTIQPTYGSAQTFTAKNITSTINQKLTTSITSPTITCSANQTLFVRFEMNAATTVSTGNIGLTALKMELARTQVTQ